jgi:hypothetical protein
MMSIIEESVPDALRDVGDFDVTLNKADATPASSTGGVPPQSPPDTPASRVEAVLKALARLNVSYLGPILLGMAVLYFATMAALDAMKGASAERLSLMQGFTDVTKQQLTALSDERKVLTAPSASLYHPSTADKGG